MSDVNWKPAADHPGEFADGERLLVAVELADGGFDYAVIETQVDEESFGISCEGEPWGWSWEDVTYWMPVPPAAPTGKGRGKS